MRADIAAIFLAAAALSACTTPDVTVTYYLPKTELLLHVVRTIDCDSAMHPFIVSSVVPTLTHSADTSPETTKPISIRSLDGTLTNTDIKFEFYDDGRLKTLNATSTGQGEAIIKSLITAAGVVFAVDGGAQREVPDACMVIKTYGGMKPLTLTFEGKVNFASARAQEIPVIADSRFYFDKLKPAMGIVCVGMSGQQNPQPPNWPGAKTAGTSSVKLPLRQPALVNVTVGTSADVACPATLPATSAIWTAQVPVAQLGTDYTLPIPKAVVFGKQVFGVGFTDSGALTSLQYAKEIGLTQVLDAASAIATASQGETTAQEAARVMAESDLIAQQQRLIRCKTNPTMCM